MTQQEQHARFEEWIASHSAILYRVANGFAAYEDRDDLMQELLLAVWKAIPSFRDASLPSTFIYRVSHNAALTWKRSQRNYQKKVERFESFGPIDSMSQDTTGPVPELLECLYAEIRRLPPLDRSLVLLSLDGVSYRDMAKIHGISESNVGVRLTRLKDKLSASMKGYSYELR